MGVEIVKNALGTAKLKASPFIFQLRKHLPEILVGTGAVSVVGGTVLACKATLKARDILDEPVVTEITVEDEDGEEEIIEAIRRDYKETKKYVMDTVNKNHNKKMCYCKWCCKRITPAQAAKTGGLCADCNSDTLPKY